MAYTPPKFTALIKRAKGDFEATNIKSLLIDAIALAHAGQTNGLYEFLAWISRQIVPHLADDDILLLFCQFWGVQRKSASYATGILTITTQGEASIVAGTQWQTTSGIIVESQQSSLIKSGVTSISVIALTEGAAGNMAGNADFTLISPIANVESKAVLDSNGLTGGADVESINSLRSRLLFRVQYPPSGGNKWDYIRWARECAGVTRAWCIPAPMYCNYVTVLFVLDEQSNIIPSQDDLNRVSEYINGHINSVTNQWEGKPPAAELIMRQPTAKALNPIIKLIPDTPETRTAVYDALVELLKGSQLAEKVYLSHIRAAISNAEGVIDHRVINLLDDIEATDNELIVLGDITWQ